MNNNNLDQQYFETLEKHITITWQFVKNHPSLLTGITTTIGFFLLVLYFIKESFFPSLILEEIIILLLVSALIGSTLLSLIFLYFLAPILMIKLSPKNKFKEDFYIYIFPILIFLITFVIVSEYKVLYDYLENYIYFIWILINILVLYFNFKYFMNKQDISLSKSDIVSLSITIFISELLLLSALLIYFAFISKTDLYEKDTTAFYLIFFLIFISFFIINIIKIKDFLTRLFINVFIFICFILFSGSYYIVPYKIVSTLQLGQVNISKVYLTAKGCQIVSLYTEDTCIMENYNLIWGYGDLFIIEKDINNVMKRFYIPKEHIISWQINKKLKKEVKND